MLAAHFDFVSTPERPERSFFHPALQPVPASRALRRSGQPEPALPPQLRRDRQPNRRRRADHAPDTRAPGPPRKTPPPATPSTATRSTTEAHTSELHSQQMLTYADYLIKK